MTLFRPCIDLHEGKVKQIVGATLTACRKKTPSENRKIRLDKMMANERFFQSLNPSPGPFPSDRADFGGGSTEYQEDYLDDDVDDGKLVDHSPKINFSSNEPASRFARRFREYSLRGGHVVMLGPGNEDAAKDALAAWPNAFHIGGGITDKNAADWISRGAEKVIVTSFLFPDAKFSQTRLDAVLAALGGNTNRLVIDLSYRRVDGRIVVVTDKWKTLTDTELSEETIRRLEPYCSEFLIHATQLEGLQRGIDTKLVRLLGKWCRVPVTFAGGASTFDDLNFVKNLSKGRVDLTIGSALDIFGGSGVTLEGCAAWNDSEPSLDSVFMKPPFIEYYSDSDEAEKGGG